MAHLLSARLRQVAYSNAQYRNEPVEIQPYFASNRSIKRCLGTVLGNSAVSPAGIHSIFIEILGLRIHALAIIGFITDTIVLSPLKSPLQY